jgi:hypothetical protein
MYIKVRLMNFCILKDVNYSGDIIGLLVEKQDVWILLLLYFCFADLGLNCFIMQIFHQSKHVRKMSHGLDLPTTRVSIQKHENTKSASCHQWFNCGNLQGAQSKACEGLRLSLEWSNKPLVVELDCSFSIDAIKRNSQDRSHLAHLITEIREFSHGSRHLIFVKVERSQNRASHWLELCEDKGKNYCLAWFRRFVSGAGS